MRERPRIEIGVWWLTMLLLLLVLFAALVVLAEAGVSPLFFSFV